MTGSVHGSSVAAALAILLAAPAVFPAGAAEPAAPVVLFDEGHGQRFRTSGRGPLDLSDLGTIVTASGGLVRTSSGPVTSGTLARKRVLIVSGPFTPFAPAEIEAVSAWLGKGGALAVMLHVEPPVRDLLHRLGVSVSNGVIREAEGVLGGDPMNFRVSRLNPHPVTSGLQGFSVYGAWALLPTSPFVETIAETGSKSWVDLNGSRKFDAGDVRQAFVVAVAGRHGKGRIAVFGDDAMFQNQFLTGENRRLAENLVSWLLGDRAEPRRASLETGQSRTK